MVVIVLYFQDQTDVLPGLPGPPHTEDFTNSQSMSGITINITHDDPDNCAASSNATSPGWDESERGRGIIRLSSPFRRRSAPESVQTTGFLSGTIDTTRWFERNEQLEAAEFFGPRKVKRRPNVLVLKSPVYLQPGGGDPVPR